jgi:Bacterial transcriptional activator domain
VTELACQRAEAVLDYADAALWVYDEVRRSLDEQLGIYPCAELSAAQAVVLRQEVRPARPAVSGRPTLRAV